MPQVTRIKKSETAIPEDLVEANGYIRDIGAVQAEINTIEAQLDADIAQLKAKAAKELEPLTQKRNNALNALFAFAAPRKVSLTAQGKTIPLPAGEFGWRLTPPAVALDGDEATIIARLEHRKLIQYVRVKKELNKQALLADKPKVKGIAYAQRDEFFSTPKQESKKPTTVTIAIDKVGK